jgi:hypothetical protein
MKNILFIMIIALFLFPPIAKSQSIDQRLKNNLQKYWTYRDRLRKYFVVVDPNDGVGTNIPVARIINGNYYFFDDGNGLLPYYIGMLATEYKLLQMTGNDCEQTRKELLYALKAYERLDKTAESYFRADHSVNSTTDLNGYFIRHDAPSNFATTWANNPNYSQLSGISTVNSTLTDWYGSAKPLPFTGDGKDIAGSKDCIWNALLNLALVKGLVDNNGGVRYKAIQIAHRMVNMMPGFTDNGLLTRWHIQNSVTNLVAGGSQGDVDEFPVTSELCTDGYRYGFTIAHNWICNENYPSVWQSPITRSLSDFRDDFHYNLGRYNTLQFLNISTYSFSSFLTIGSNNNEFGEDIYGFLKSNGDLNDDLNYHLPLIYELLHGPLCNSSSTFNPLSETDIEYYLSLLDQAPNSGPNNITDNSIWSKSDQILLWPESSLIYGDENYSGIDYMLLHNLFWLIYIQTYGYSINNHKAYPGTPEGNSPDPSNNYPYSAPDLLEYGNIIVETSHINSGYGHKDNASIIRLKPGFEVGNGGYYRAYTTDKSWPYHVGYEILPPASYPSPIYTSSKKARIINNNKVSPDTIKNKLLIVSEDNLLSLKFYPNPFIDKLYFNGARDFNATIFDLNGREVITFNNVNTEIDLSDLQKGIYMLKIELNGKTMMNKIVKK